MIEYTKTRFYVDEVIYKKLIRFPDYDLKIIVIPKLGNHPKGNYNIPNKKAIHFIDIKKEAYNWKKNQNFHQDSIPKDLKDFFTYK